MYDALVLATDGSSPASAAVDHAVGLARETGATLHVLSVVDTADLDLFTDAAAVDGTLRGAAEDAVADAVERAGDSGVEAAGAVRVGIPHREICAYADDCGADLVVLGTHGRSGLSRLLIGSVTARVVRTARRPVLVVPGTPRTE